MTRAQDISSEKQGDMMAGKRPAYVIAEVEITDAAVFQEYVSKAVPTLAAVNARIIARSKPHAKEGTAPVGEIVIVAFESLEDAQRWYGSSPYSDTIPIRQRSANTRLFIVEGEPQ
jgi:uncharacterized protein (DUF1330 family)